jgi:hypothetical protein
MILSPAIPSFVDPAQESDCEWLSTDDCRLRNSFKASPFGYDCNFVNLRFRLAFVVPPGAPEPNELNKIFLSYWQELASQA